MDSILFARNSVAPIPALKDRACGAKCWVKDGIEAGNEGREAGSPAIHGGE